jgi:excisionase family DNA binding protein
MESFPTLLTEEEAAKFLTLSVKTLQAWRSRGHALPYHKMGRSIRYSIDSLRSFIDSQKRRSTSDPGPGLGTHST